MVAVCTIALNFGLNKIDPVLLFVVFWDLHKSLESYVQFIGRVERSGNHGLSVQLIKNTDEAIITDGLNLKNMVSSPDIVLEKYVDLLKLIFLQPPGADLRSLSYNVVYAKFGSHKDVLEFMFQLLAVQGLLTVSTCTADICVISFLEKYSSKKIIYDAIKDISPSVKTSLENNSTLNKTGLALEINLKNVCIDLNMSYEHLKGVSVRLFNMYYENCSFAYKNCYFNFCLTNEGKKVVTDVQILLVAETLRSFRDKDIKRAVSDIAAVLKFVLSKECYSVQLADYFNPVSINEVERSAIRDGCYCSQCKNLRDREVFLGWD